MQKKFVSWLGAHGWSVLAHPTDPHVDVYAERGAARLLGEVKGHTRAIGTDVDTAYGWLLRRMGTDPTARYALVVPDVVGVVAAATRVRGPILEMLGITVFAVDEDGAVRVVTGHQPRSA